MKIYVLRHGQTDWNLEKRIQGISDIELNSNGIEQAKQVKEKIKELGIDLILCSPLKRAVKTADIINEDEKIEIIYDDRFIERNFGDFEGLVVTETDIYKSQILFDTNINYSENNVEPINELISRITKSLDEIKQKYQDRKVLIITHGALIRSVNAYFNGIPENGIIDSTGLKNCEIAEFEYKN